MTTADFMLERPDRPAGGRAALWVTAAVVAAASHTGVALVALRQQAPPLPQDSAPPAITIDLAPMPTAPAGA
jgi:periplasmic protein TonB